MLAWAEELGAEATTVTELLEEDNEEVGLGALLHILLLEEVHLRFIFLQVKLEIMAQIQKVNRKAISNAQKVNDSCSALDFHTCTFFFQVHKFMIAPKDFSLPGGELTPTMKLKRHTVMEMYEKKIQQVILKIDHLDRFCPNSISIMNQLYLCRCTSTRRRVPCGDDLLLHSMPSSRSIIT